MSTRLAERLKEETRGLHTSVERSRYMSALLRGRMDRAGYLALLTQLLPIYDTLEAALARHAADPALAALDTTALARTRALTDDLAALGSPPDERSGSAAILPACIDYVARLRQLEASRPELLLAHAYVRYLGDLSGGQLLRRIVADQLQLPPGIGVSFYDFGDAARVKRLTDDVRRALELAVVDDEAVVEEARSAFARHGVLFDQLALACGLQEPPPTRA